MFNLKHHINDYLKHLGYSLVRDYRPTIVGAPTILGSFPPRDEYARVGRPENYYIHDGYNHRTQISYYDDTVSSDEWQLEVYQFAREICNREGLKSVCDIGCGSGFKLMRFFNDLKTIGMDVPETVDFLRKRWPGRLWIESNFRDLPSFSIQMAIASDVVEHLLNPNDLLSYISHLQPEYIVLSTPDRNLLRVGSHNGPPLNTAHIREWSFAEFDAYVSSHFTIEDHFISCASQGTQCVLCKPVRYSSDLV